MYPNRFVMRRLCLFVTVLFLAISLNAQTVNDFDRNQYNVVRIGEQEWIRENLRATRFNDGSEIPLVKDSTEWANIMSPGFCWYNNDSVNYGGLNGAIYNWYAVSDTMTNSKNLCPVGWHVPTKQDFLDLTIYIKMSLLAGIDGNAMSAMLDVAKALSSTSYWETSGELGSVGNTDFPDKRNVSGFSAFPGGIRNPTGAFVGYGKFGFWWGSTKEEQPGKGCLVAIYNDNSTVGFYQGNFNIGCSVRCVRDVPSDKNQGENQNGKFIIK
jgi:uncharacterized protein (TIGR02145 family)